MRVAPARDSFERARATRKKTLGSAHPDTATMRGNLAALFARRRPPARIIERLKSLERWSARSAQTELVGSHHVVFNNILLFCTSDGRQIKRRDCRYPSYFATALSTRRGRVVVLQPCPPSWRQDDRHALAL